MITDEVNNLLMSARSGKAPLALKGHILLLNWNNQVGQGGLCTPLGWGGGVGVGVRRGWEGKEALGGVGVGVGMRVEVGEVEGLGVGMDVGMVGVMVEGGGGLGMGESGGGV